MVPEADMFCNEEIEPEILADLDEALGDFEGERVPYNHFTLA